jgi:hypothetical protein
MEEMLRFHLDGRPVASQDEARIFAHFIDGPGYSASELKSLADEAAELAMQVSQRDLLRPPPTRCGGKGVSVNNQRATGTVSELSLSFIAARACGYIRVSLRANAFGPP